MKINNVEFDFRIAKLEHAAKLEMAMTVAARNIQFFFPMREERNVNINAPTTIPTRLMKLNTVI